MVLRCSTVYLGLLEAGLDKLWSTAEPLGPASVGALSEAAGRVNDQSRAEHVLCASIASASWASVSKHAM